MGVEPKIGVARNGWFIMEHPIKMDDLGYHYFCKHPCFLFDCDVEEMVIEFKR